MKSIWKIRLILLVLFVASATLFAAGTSASAASSAAKIYTLKVASVGTPGDSLTLALDSFIDGIKKRSNGALVGEAFYSSQLGAHRDYIDGMQMNSIQVCEIATSVLATVDSRFMVFDLPYISKSVQNQVAVLNSGIGNQLSNDLAKKAKIKVIGWLVRTPRNVYSAKGPIKTADDFRGLKIRTMESPPMIRAMQLLSAKATPIPANERYMALQTGVVEAAENNSGEIYAKKEYEVTKYLSKTSHIIQPNAICIGSAFFDSLPANLQKIVLEEGKKAGEVGTKNDVDKVAAVEVELTKAGMTINDIPDKSSFVKALAPLYTEYQTKIGKDLIDAFLK
jgi:tripartite ATP-independent transporter DctP family solute receptor